MYHVLTTPLRVYFSVSSLIFCMNSSINPINPKNLCLFMPLNTYTCSLLPTPRLVYTLTCLPYVCIGPSFYHYRSTILCWCHCNRGGNEGWFPFRYPFHLNPCCGGVSCCGGDPVRRYTYAHWNSLHCSWCGFPWSPAQSSSPSNSVWWNTINDIFL